MREIDNNKVKVKVRRPVAQSHGISRREAGDSEDSLTQNYCGCQHKVKLHQLIIGQFDEQYTAIHLALTELEQTQLQKLLNTENLVGNLQDIEKV